MRARVAAWALVGIALVCAVSGAHYAGQVVGYSRVDPAALGQVIADATRATILIVVAGCAVIGLVVLRGVAEMLNQVLGSTGTPEPLAGSVDVGTARADDH